MNRINQGKVTAVAIPDGKKLDDWQSSAAFSGARPARMAGRSHVVLTSRSHPSASRRRNLLHHESLQVDASESRRYIIYSSLLSVSMVGRGAVSSETAPAFFQKDSAIVHTCLRQTRMNLAIRGIDANLGPGNADSFRTDLHPGLKADFVPVRKDLANPPFNTSDWGGENLRQDVRWKFGNRTLAALRDALLPKLLSDELRVPAAEKLVEVNA